MVVLRFELVELCLRRVLMRELSGALPLANDWVKGAEPYRPRGARRRGRPPHQPELHPSALDAGASF
jgi:hypothetical protein